MFEDKQMRRNIRIGVIIIVVAAVFRLWGIAREWLESYVENEAQYQLRQETASGDFSDADELVCLNEETSFKVVIQDDAQLLDGEQEQELAAVMQEITAYGNAAFKTIDQNAGSTESYARQYYKEQFGTDSGTLFLIDMDNRNIWIHSDGAVYQVVTKSYANTITDNVYRYASDGDYYRCAAQAFDQALTLLEGNKIAQPMKYISNALLAVILALLLNYGLVSCFARMRKPRGRKLSGNGGNHFSYTLPQAVFVRESQTYHPVSSGSSGGSGGSSSSGGGSGSSGGSSGGGGGHKF